MTRSAAIMLQGTGSDVGKSLLAAGLCRAFHNRGLEVRPFKPQNMSNNAAVARGPNGETGEIGRAQALQARACRVEPHVHMNPVLLKPQTDTGAQVVVRGKVAGAAKARDYHDLKPTLLPKVLESFEVLGAGADLVVVEGAGSPAEVNLRVSDIANMGFAEAADIPVVLVGDIDRGGVIASLVGTHALLDSRERRRVKGCLINKFRGDARLFDEGLRIIAEKTGWPSLGVVPYFARAAALPMEDAFALERAAPADGNANGRLVVAVPRFSRIANFDDLDPLAAEPEVDLRFIEPGRPIPSDADLIVLPGSKATLRDLDDLRAQGWDEDIRSHHRRGGAVLGICGGYQILGETVADPEGLEGPARTEPGLGLLSVRTVLRAAKELSRRTATDCLSGREVRGYEMHVGRTEGPATDRPWFRKPDGSTDGAVGADGLIFGTYFHGLFAADGFRRHFLKSLRPSFRGRCRFEALAEQALEDLAGHLENHVDLDGLLAFARGSGG